MLESFLASLDEAMVSIINQPLGRYEVVFGGWELGIDTSSGVVFHARYIGG